MTPSLTATPPPGLLTETRTGWYLLAANSVVECGPFATEREAYSAAAWMDAQGEGVNPAPWVPRYSRSGLQVGSRWRPARKPTGQASV